MFGLTRPIFQYREKSHIVICYYMPHHWTREERMAAYPRQPVLIYMASGYDTPPTQFVVFGGLDKALKFADEEFGKEISEDDWRAIQGLPPKEKNKSIYQIPERDPNYTPPPTKLATIGVISDALEARNERCIDDYGCSSF